MATVNFSIPDKIKEVFNAVFAGRNKSAIIAELMVRDRREYPRCPGTIAGMIRVVVA